MKIVKVFIKFMFAGIVAIAFLSLFLCFYYLVPVHQGNSNGNTDYVWEPNAIWFNAKEGIAWGKYDDNGFNNDKVIDNPDIIILGSSHMEARQVFYEQSVAGILSSKFKGKYTVYNYGISGHDFFKVCQYLEQNLKLHSKVPKIVIIETSIVNLTKENVYKILNSEVEYTKSFDGGIIGKLQKIPFFRMIYQQIKDGLLDIFYTSNKNVTNDDNDLKYDEEAYGKLFDYLRNLEKEYNTQIIIFYHPTETLKSDGSIFFEEGEDLLLFDKNAEKNEIDFINMKDSFEEMYYSKHLVPHGFITGKLGYGHLNASGHNAIAEKLYKKIILMEKEGKICQ